MARGRSREVKGEGGYRARRRKIKEERRERERDPESSVQCFPALFENCMAEPA